MGSFKSNAKPAVYGYPPALEEKKKEAGEKVATAVLSITAKQKRKEKEAEKKKEKESNKMEVDENVKSEKDKKEEKSEDKDKKDEKDEKKDAEKEVKKEDLTFDTLANPARVIKPQLKVVSVDKDSSRYRPIKDVVIGGIVMMKNTSGEPCKVVEPMVVKKASADDEDEKEPEAPEPFEYIEEDEK